MRGAAGLSLLIAAESTPALPGWKLYLDRDDELVPFCPERAEREFGLVSRGGQDSRRASDPF